MGQRKQINKRLKRRVMLRLSFVILLGLLVIGGIAAAILLLTRQGTPSAQLTALPFQAQTGYTYTGSGFLYREGDGIAYYDLADEGKNYTASVTASDMQLVGSPTAHVIYNSLALKIVGAEFPNEFPGQLISVKCGSSHVAALRADAAGVEGIQVFDLAGQQKDQLAFDTQYIVDYGFYTAKSEYLWVHTLDVQSGAPISTIHLYNMTSGSTSGLLQVQNQLIERVCFSNSSIFLVGTNQIIRYSLENNRESYQEMVYGWQMIDYATTPAFLLSPRSSETLGTLKLLTCAEADLSGASETILQAPVGALGAFLVSGKLAVVTADTLYYYDYNGKELSQYDLGQTISSASKLDSSTLLLQSGDALFVMNTK